MYMNVNKEATKSKRYYSDR